MNEVTPSPTDRKEECWLRRNQRGRRSPREPRGAFWRLKDSASANDSLSQRGKHGSGMLAHYCNRYLATKRFYGGFVPVLTTNNGRVIPFPIVVRGRMCWERKFLLIISHTVQLWPEFGCCGAVSNWRLQQFKNPQSILLPVVWSFCTHSLAPLCRDDDFYIRNKQPALVTLSQIFISFSRIRTIKF